MKNNSNLVLKILRSIQIIGAIIMIGGVVVGFLAEEDEWNPLVFFGMVITFSALLALNYLGRKKSQTEDAPEIDDPDQE